MLHGRYDEAEGGKVKLENKKVGVTKIKIEYFWADL